MMLNEKSIKRGRLMYIYQAGLEYLISILVAGSFLATITKELGFSDSLTGIISSIISLGCLFQLLSVMFRRKKVKNFVIVLSVANQILFTLLYAVPLFELGKKIKTIIFVIFIITAYILYNFAHPKKINWLMSLVDDSERGIYTANKEIVSLVAGMAFSYAMGAVVDHFKEMGKTYEAFILSMVVIFVLMILHTVTMVLTPEKEQEISVKRNPFVSIGVIIGDKNLLKVTLVFALYYASHYASIPFYAVYQINELSISLKTIAIFSIITSASRIAFSRFWGRYADKTSFVNMLTKCFVILALSYVFTLFAVPSNGFLMFTFYYIAYGVAMGGINSALMNMVFDYAPYEIRSNALAITQSVAGVTGFITTLSVSPLVTYIQSSGNKLFGMNIYAQQFLSLISVILAVFAFIFVKTIRKEEKL